MQWKPSFTYKTRQVLTITLFWVLTGMLMELHNAVNYDPVTRRYFLYFLFGRSMAEHLLITSVGPLLGGLAGGSFIVFYQREKLKGKTYGRKLLVHSVLYILFVSICILLVGLIGAWYSREWGTYWSNFYNDVFSLRVLRLLIAWYVVVTCTIFLLDVSERYGPGTLKRMLLGKYHTPGKEQRVFMFLDLRSSTAIAERIGDEKYFRMLHFFYQVANEAILNSRGEIYQYVGDEIVVSWPWEEGVKQAACLSCFSRISDAVQTHKERFESEFDVVPGFKAGIHAGGVMTGVIGTIKKEIVYSGDVLNTTARVVALCNEYGQDLMVSGTIYEALKSTPGYRFTFLGSPSLRGKSVILDLYGVKRE